MKSALLLIAGFTLLTLSPVFGQLTVNNGFTAQQLGNNLAGNNVNVFNASITGTADQYGTFQYVGTDLGLNSGVILSTGDIADAIGPNNSGNTSSSLGGPGDADLSALAGFNTNDAVVFEFDFEVQGDEIEFNFVFMSEEYNEFVGTGFNDVFAFYISGPGIVGQENLAVVPGTTTPVTINTINNGSFWQYYNDNDNGTVNIEFDGFTTLMTASKNGLQQCGIYTLSLRIADGSDSAYDSAVLLQENSLVQSNISASSSTFSANNTALEGCIDASFTFQLDSALTTNVQIPIGIGGTATNGVDYAQIDTMITIPAGQLSATIIIDAIADGITEGQEVIELYYTPTPCAPQDTVFLYIDDYTPLEYTVDPTDISCWGAMDGMVDLAVTGGIAPYTLTLTDSATGNVTSYNSFPVNGLDEGTYYVEVIDGYGCTAEDIVAGNFFDAGQTFIPDGQGGSYQSSTVLSGFGAGQTVASADQIQSVCATMEHSRIGELLITLTAPDGTQVILKDQPGGAVTNFGEPCAVGPTDGGTGNQNTDPGIGYTYCWQNISTYGTMVSEANNYTYTYTNICDGSQQSDKYLPAGSYQPEESFAGFIGAPLNGAWTIEVTDMIPNNNGYIFDWSITLQADLPDSIFTITQPNAPTVSDVVVQPDCGMNNGSIDLTVSGDAPPYTFLWSTGATTEDISGIGAGVYTVDITDDSLCTITYQVNVSNNGSLTLGGVVTDESCYQLNDGAIDLTPNGTMPYTFSWSNGATTEDLSGLAPGNYTVTVTDGTGCIGSTTFTVNAAGQINISANITNENCGDQEGIIDITVQGGTNPFTYLWSNGETTQDINELAQGTYNVQLTDVNGCQAADTFSVINLVGNCIPNCDLAITNAIVLDENCGTGNGYIDITAFTSNGPIAASWNTGATTQDLFNLSAGTYEITLTDNEGCEVIQAYTLTNQTGTLAIQSANTTNEYCGNGQGAIDLTVTGGAQPYTYNWSNGATTQDLTGLVAGTYTVTVTDDNGCSTSTSATIINDAGTLELIYGNAVDEVCSNSTGSIDIIVQGGQQPYSYSWSNGTTSEDLINIPAGNYTCTITDAGGCSIVTPTYVVENQSGSLVFDNIDIDNEICTNGLGDIELFISGGVQPYSILWNTGATTAQISNLPAGTYSASVTDNNGCSMSTGNLVVLNESGTLQLTGVTAFDELCSNNSGSINVTVTGGTAPISYQWDNGSTSQDLTNLGAGNYNCTIMDVNGCTVYASATIQNDPGILSVDNIIVTDENCGAGDGALDAIISGATMPATYQWDSGQTTEDISGLNAGTYTLTVTDANGCATSGSANVNNNAGTLQVTSEQVTNEICGDGQGAIAISTTGGVQPLTFSWNNGATTESISGLSAGTYTLTVTDNNGCAITAGPYTVNNSSGTLSATLASATDETCSNGGGSIDANVTGGTMPYTFSWNSGQTTEDISGLSAGTYTLTVTDAGGCSDQLTVTITNDPGTLAISNIVVTDETCGNGSGAIDITVSGGTPTYTYAWSNTATTEDISGLTSGTYDVTVTDGAGCMVNSGNIQVANSPGSFTLTGVNVTSEVCGDTTGNIDILVTGATGGVTYTWSNGATTQTIGNLSAGSYTGTATDAAGCVLNFSGTVINDPGNLVVSGALTDPTCNGGNGAIDITITGNNGPTTYVWSNGATVEDISGLTAGTYTVNVTDSIGCYNTYVGTISNSGNPEITSVSVTDEQCGNVDGAITVNVNGGTQPYTYSWTAPQTTPCCSYTLDMQDLGNSWNGASIDVYIDGALQGNYTVPGGGANVETFPVCDGQTIELYWNTGGFDNEVSFDLLDASGTIVFSQGASPTAGLLYTGTASCTAQPLNGATLTNLSAGTYTVVVTDANGCQDSTTIVVNNTSGTLQIANANVTNETCTDANGAIDLTVNGSAPFTYSWNNGATTEDIANLGAGTYTVIVSDQQGCSTSESYTLTDFNNGLALASFTITDETCGDGQGAIDITATGGIGALSYDWSNGSTAEDIILLNAGTYSVIISDGSICDFDTTFTVVNNANGMAATTSVSDEQCGNANGSITLSVTGGTAPLTYLWSNGAVSANIAGLAAGTYTCEVTDNTGCILNITETVSNTAGTLAATAAITDEDCGGADGAVDVTVTGGQSPYTYAWSSGQTTEDISNLTYGTYSVTITDANGCSITESYNVASGGTFNYTAVVTNEDCTAGNGSIDLTFTGFNPPDQTNWSNGATTQDISGLSSGWYTIEIIENGFGACTMVDSFYVGVNQGTLYVDSIVETQENCSASNGALDAFVSGGTMPYTYSWDNGATTEDISGLSAGSYTLTVTDNNGCEATGSATIFNATFGFGIAGATITDETCGDGTGAITVTASGGASPYTFAWSNGGSTANITGLSAGTYTVTVTDNNGCVTTGSYTVNNNTNGFLASAVVTDETCGTMNGAIDVTTVGGVGPISFLWDTGATTEDISGLDGGTYTIDITDNSGCTLTLTETVQSFSDNFQLNAPIVTDEVCGDSTGSIVLNPTGGTGNLIYSWDVPSPCCSYTLNMYDLNNNGWGGTPIPEVLVYINGTLYGNFTVPVGNGNSFNSESIPVCTGDLIEFEYVEAAQNQNNTYEVLDAQGNVIFSDGPNPFNGIAFTTTAACPAPSSNTLTDLTSGAYPVTVTDQVGCVLTDTIIVGNNTGGFDFASAVITDEYCQNGSGAIDIEMTGGVSPYTYDWETGATTQDLSGLSAGTYTVIVQDDAGCQIVDSFTVVDSTGNFQIDSFVVTDELCTDGNGSIDITVVGGVAPLTFAWDNGATTEDISGLSAGTYGVTITDNGGCQVTGSYTVTDQSSGISISGASVTDETCGDAAGAIDITMTGGNMPYTFSWSNGATTEDLSGLSEGQYIVNITDASGCSVADTFDIINNTNGFMLSNTQVTDAACDNADGAIDITVAGGVMPYTFSWSNGATTEDISGITAGSYDVTVSDNAGCSFTETIVVNSIGSPVDVTDTLINNASCATCTDGYIDLTLPVSGEPYTYLWNTGATSQDITFLTPGTYTVTITNSFGCTTTETYVVKDVTGIDYLESFVLEVYPNPSHGVFEINFSQVGSDELELTVTDATGRLVHDLGSVHDTKGTVNVDLSKHPTGVYFLNVKSGDRTIRVERLVINK